MTQDNPKDTTPTTEATQNETPKKKRHLIKSPWLRIPLKTIGWILLIVLLIPVAIYIPPVQTALKNLACKIAHDSTGMTIDVEEFRLKFPLDVSLKGVSVIEASGDTMVQAKEAIADVKLLPLLRLDVRLKKLTLLDGYYRFVAPDSSMIMKIRAHRLEVDDKSSANIKTSEILLNKVALQGGDISLYMDVWRQQPTPQDSTATPFLIKAHDLDIKDIKFSMSMLPTIDTLVVDAKKIHLLDGIVDLRDNKVDASLVNLDGGYFKYIAPTPEYVATHPVPVDSTAVASPPMTINIDSIAVDNISGLYAIKGAKPLPGFDANYIEVSDVSAGLRHFYNQATSLRLPVSRLSAKERCGLYVTSGSGVVAMTEQGIEIDGLQVNTPYSKVAATAGIPFALMELKPSAPVNVSAVASIGMPDVESFMPDLRQYIAMLGTRNPLNANIAVNGQLDNLSIDRLDAAIPGLFSLRASGYARNALDFKRLIASVDIDGELVNPSPIEKMAGDLGVPIPPLKIKGTAGAAGETYTADISVATPHGNVLANGKVALSSEEYRADVDIDRVNVAQFMPDLGIGYATASLRAHGDGFNPTKPNAATDVSLCVDEIFYNGRRLRDISLQAILHQGEYQIEIDSPNEEINLEAALSGSIDGDDFTATGDVRLYRADLYTLGFTPDECDVKALLDIDAKFNPTAWLYDADLKLDQLEYRTPTSEIILPQGIDAKILATEDNVNLLVDGDQLSLSFNSPEGLEKIVDSFSKAADMAMRQIDARSLDVDSLQHILPPFTLDADASGSGMLASLLQPSGIGIDSFKLHLRNDSLISGNAALQSLNTGSMTIDTITLGLKERGKMLDYKVHVGNRPGTLDEFASVNLNGYLGDNRLSAYLTQKNIMGDTGYRLGFTAAVADSTVDLHFTPLKAMIAYIPWTFNDDNNISYNLTNRHVDANLKASSRESSILLMTEPSADGGEDLHLNLANIQVEDFLKMSIMAPPIKASVNSDIRVHYDGKVLRGKGTLDINNFIYEKTRVGDFNFNLLAGMDMQGGSGAKIGLKINGQEAMTLGALLKSTDTGLEPEKVKLDLTSFPLTIANAFLPADMAKLSGRLNGHFLMTGNLTKPILNGALATDSVGVFIPMMGSSIKFDNDSISVADNILDFNKFSLFGANKNPLTLDGKVDATSLSDISFDLSANATDFQLINNDRRAKSDLYGKLFLNLAATVKGPMKHFDINGNVNILGNSDVYYTIPGGSEALTATSDADVVKFVNFNDSTQVEKADSLASSIAMRIRAALTISPGTQVTVNLSGNGTDKVQLSPSGTLNYFQNFMGDMTLNGQLFLGNGMARYNLPVMGEKKFTFVPSSYVIFNGDIMNPTLNISATDQVKASVVNASGNSNLVNFLINLNVTNNLAAPKVVFDLSTDDDLTVQNELSSMTPDQRSAAAMNMLITGQYSGNGSKTLNGNFVTGNLYSMLTAQLNSMLAKNVRGVDLSFGIDQYDRSVNGQQSSAMSYSYQVSKSLFNNKFKIVVGGNYSTDDSADENIAENLISDISFEYMLKQTNNLSMLVKLFRHVGYESILEGEVSEMGVGFVMRRRLSDLRKLFKVRWHKRKPTVATDSIVALPAKEQATLKNDENDTDSIK